MFSLPCEKTEESEVGTSLDSQVGPSEREKLGISLDAESGQRDSVALTLQWPWGESQPENVGGRRSW